MSVGRLKKQTFAVVTNDDSLEPPPELSYVIRSREQSKQFKFIMSENQQHGPSIVTRPIWAAKVKGIAKLHEALILQRGKTDAVRIYTTVSIKTCQI